jgi:signal transduction histidine kinase
MTPILIVDDEKDNLEALQRLLRNQFTVVTTTSPFDALKLVQKQEFSVVVSDQRMPEMTGVELLEKIKAITPRSTRILLTGYTDLDSVIGAINRGHVYRYIGKPWDSEELKSILRQAEEAFSLKKELDEKNRSLAQALEDLSRLDKAKARFMNLISHELNTPLTSLQAFLSLLEEKKNQDAESQKALSAFRKSLDRLSEIVGEVISFVQMESGESFSLASVPLNEILTNSVKSTRAEFDKKKVKFTGEVSKEIKVLADKKALEMALSKLLKDMVYRAPAGSEVKLNSTLMGNKTKLTFLRQGEVITSQIFDPLEAGGNVLNHNRNMGLGLALFKCVVEGHGSEIHLTSNDKSGTSIAFDLTTAH